VGNNALDPAIVSMLYSLFAGQIKSLKAKIMLQVLRKLAPSGGGGGGSSTGAPPIQNWGQAIKNSIGGLSKLAKASLIVAAILIVVVVAFKVFIELLKHSINRLKSMTTLFYQSMGQGKESGQLKGIAKLAGISEAEIGAMAQAEPGGARVLIDKARQLMMNPDGPEAKMHQARALGIEQLAGLIDADKSDWAKAMDVKNQGALEASRKAMKNWNQGLGDLKTSLDGVVTAMAPVIDILGRYMSMLAKGITVFVEVVKGILKLFLAPLIAAYAMFTRNDKLMQVANEMKNASSKFDKAVDKWTSKTGTFGAGQRGNNPYPHGWNYAQHQMNMRLMGESLGAFEF
jgi:hypothetical protein